MICVNGFFMLQLASILYDLLAGPLYGGTLIYAHLLPQETESKSDGLLIDYIQWFFLLQGERNREQKYR
jgi:hypothetical protein